MAKKKQRIYTFDLETDPFLYGRLPMSFCAGLYDGAEFQSFWGDDHLLKAREAIEQLPPGIIYIHNGGKFDIYYFIDWIVGQADQDEFDLLIINNRIVKATMKCNGGFHEIRDSYAILPFPLKTYLKDDIEYSKMEKEVRDLNRDEIVSYLKTDCVSLWDLCYNFVNDFGPKLTIGGTAMGLLREMHGFECLDAKDDGKIRGKFFYGGRVQCFKKGIVTDDLKVYDVNSMYPYVMRNFKHPITRVGWVSKDISKFTAFVTVEGKNYGAFPSREKDGGIRFDREDGTFHVTIHEWEAALRHSMFVPTRIVECINFCDKSTFRQFVDHFYNARIEAKDSGDHIHALFYKYILNSAYGKFAQNPAGYFDYKVTRSDRCLSGEGSPWIPAFLPNENYIIWKAQATDYKHFNVATGASITGAARAVLMDAIARSDSPVYCDTDSIICRSISGLESDPKKLGAWKTEADADMVAVGGKKLYAVFKDGKCVKKAHKGVSLTPDEIVRICKGEKIETRRDAPTFKIGAVSMEKLTSDSIQHSFVSRKVGMR